MGKRIRFNSPEVRNLFFKKALEINGLITWNQLKIFLNIRRSLLSNYRGGKFTLPEKMYNLLTLQFDKADLDYFSKNSSLIDEGWGRIKAGKMTYSKYQDIFDEGRKKAISAAQNRANKFNINMPLCKKLAYFMGLFIGDGFTNKYQRYYLIQFTGDINEKTFYENLVSKYCSDLFKLTPKINKDRVANAIRVNLYSKCLFEMITQRFNISAGRKSQTVLIPEEILNAKPEIAKACVRGLYDAEGCVFFDKRIIYKKPYVRIELHMCNLALLKQVSIILTKFGIDNVLGITKGNLRVTIYGSENVKKFVREIGFMNPKQLNKVGCFKD